MQLNSQTPCIFMFKNWENLNFIFPSIKHSKIILPVSVTRKKIRFNYKTTNLKTKDYKSVKKIIEKSYFLIIWCIIYNELYMNRSFSLLSHITLNFLCNKSFCTLSCDNDLVKTNYGHYVIWSLNIMFITTLDWKMHKTMARHVRLHTFFLRV